MTLPSFSNFGFGFPRFDTGFAAGLALGIAVWLVLLWIIRRQRKLAGELAAKASQYDRERQIADVLQDALMPYDVISVPGLRIHARYRPAREADRVGGDWYEALPAPDGRVLIIVGDVSGHGITAIKEMSRLRGKIIAAAMHETDPGAILTEANRQLIRTAGDDPILGTALCAFVDPAKGQVSYATAGHPPPVFADPKTGARFLASDGLMLGLQPRVYETRVAQATDGALLVLYTDGLIEFTRDILAGEKNLLRAAEEVAAADVENPAMAIKQRILGDASPEDDIAIVTIVFVPVRTRIPQVATPIGG